MIVLNAGESRVFRLPRWGLLVYEVFRLVVLIRAISGEALGDQFPGLIFGAANTLFVLMAFFLLVDFCRYSVYASLYAAGKIITVIALAGCVFFWRERIIQAIILREAVPLLESLFIITLGDFVSAGAGIFLALGARQAEGAGKEGETGAAENGGL
jgi:hypothetical protein